MHQVRGRGAGELLQLATWCAGQGWSAPIARLELEQPDVDQVRGRAPAEDLLLQPVEMLRKNATS